MADAMETLKGILGDNAEDTIKSVMGSLSGGNSTDNNGGKSGGNSGINMDELLQDNSLQYIMQMRDIMSKLANNHDDPRSNLLMSLKPYMRTGRQQSIDNAVRLLNLTKLPSILRQK